MNKSKSPEKLLEVRKTIKSKKPEFIQQDYHKKRRLSRKWKRPTGLQSKMRHQFKGYNKRVKQGWRSPVEIRGFNNKGFNTVVVSSIEQLDYISNPNTSVNSAKTSSPSTNSKSSTQLFNSMSNNSTKPLTKSAPIGIIISGTVGLKKKLQILEKAQQLKLTVVNADYAKLKETHESMKAKKNEEKKKKDEHKKKSIEDALKKAEKKKKDTEKSSQQPSEAETADAEADKKELEKKEKDDVLIHKQL